MKAAALAIVEYLLGSGAKLGPSIEVRRARLCLSGVARVPDQTDVISHIKALDDHQDALYPPDARYALDLNSLEASNLISSTVSRATGFAGPSARILNIH